MTIETADFPQADRLEQVGQAALAIAKGSRADKEIETFIGLDSGGRQGRYYRLSAEILGLIQNQHNNAALTPLGEEFATLSSASARMDFLARCLVDTPVFREALRYIHKYNPSDNQLKLWFRNFYPGSENTANRRFHTFINYLRDSGLLQKSQSRYQIQKYVGAVVTQTSDSAQKLSYRKMTQSSPTQAISDSNSMIRIDVDVQKRERANQIHWQLLDSKSKFLDNRNLKPYANEHIDLYTEIKGDVILYEMKSVNPEASNLLSQIRKAVSQLYEYRYIFKEPKAKLCIVTNHGIAKKDDWLLSYLAKDRAIAYEWTDDFLNFQCNSDSKPLLGAFSP